MRDPKWTPGPWKQSLPDDTAIYGADGWPVCETGVNQGYDEHFERIEADARLIAAAPDLYEALVAIYDAWYNLDGSDYRRLKAALAKANGENNG